MAKNKIQVKFELVEDQIFFKETDRNFLFAIQGEFEEEKMNEYREALNIVQNFQKELLEKHEKERRK
jgi:hypothetical protein